MSETFKCVLQPHLTEDVECRLTLKSSVLLSVFVLDVNVVFRR